MVGDGEAALASARAQRPDLVALDLGLPGMDGMDVARSLRRKHDTPIVMVTARGEETDRIVGLELGADDYVVKPFSPKELVARVRAVPRRSGVAKTASEATIRVGDVRIEPSRLRVTVGERSIELTLTEFQRRRFVLRLALFFALFLVAVVGVNVLVFHGIGRPGAG